MLHRSIKIRNKITRENKNLDSKYLEIYKQENKNRDSKYLENNKQENN